MVVVVLVAVGQQGSGWWWGWAWCFLGSFLRDESSGTDAPSLIGLTAEGGSF